jgi:cytochrome c-type biogenesis protein CcmE
MATPEPIERSKGPLIAIASLVVAGLALAFIAYGNLGENLVYYWSPSDMLGQGAKAFGPTIRLGGVVVPGSIRWNATHSALSFEVADGPKAGEAKVAVSCEQVPPQMFREGIGVVVEGTFDASQVFKTSRLMVNHSNEYRPPKPGEDPKKWKESLADPQSAAR